MHPPASQKFFGFAFAEAEAARYKCSMTISNRFPPVVVTYLARGKRTAKRFANPYKARRFYAAKLKAEADPHVQTDPMQPQPQG